ncbi:MAG TPA: hypothetical protein VK539_10450, partial [Myxococcaceae bacterium]|nr:hypothetical protein [Myxococcaceae bacterium]
EVREELAPLAFDAFVERSFRILLRRSPESVVELGLERELDVGRTFLDDVSDAFVAQTRAQQGVVLQLLKGYDRAALSRTQQVTYDVYAWWLEERQRDARFEAQALAWEPPAGATRARGSRGPRTSLSAWRTSGRHGTAAQAALPSGRGKSLDWACGVS